MDGCVDGGPAYRSIVHLEVFAAVLDGGAIGGHGCHVAVAGRQLHHLVVPLFVHFSQRVRRSLHGLLDLTAKGKTRVNLVPGHLSTHSSIGV